MPDNDVTLRPRSDVFAEAARRGLAPSDDRFDRFRRAGLIDELKPLRGTNQHGFTPDQAQRFFDLLALCQKLGTKRPRASALAFWLCWDGATDVPPDLVCEHIERSIITFLRFLGRQYGRRRVPRRSADSAERWRRAGTPWAKPFIKEFLASHVGNAIVLDVLSTVVGLTLRMLFSRTSFDAVSGILQRLARFLGIDNVTPESMRAVWSVALECVELFSIDEDTNPLLRAVRDVRSTQRSEIIGIVHDTRPVIAVMAYVFPIYNVEGAPAIAEPKTDTSIARFRIFPPAFCSIFAHTRKEPRTIDIREGLRHGDVEPLLTEFRQIRVIRDSILLRLTKEPQR